MPTRLPDPLGQFEDGIGRHLMIFWCWPARGSRAGRKHNCFSNWAPRLLERPHSASVRLIWSVLIVIARSDVRKADRGCCDSEQADTRSSEGGMLCLLEGCVRSPSPPLCAPLPSHVRLTVRQRLLHTPPEPVPRSSATSTASRAAATRRSISPTARLWRRPTG